MQFHLNGFRTGDPEISEPSEEFETSSASDTLPAEVDVLIVGCGPAGLALAAQLAAFPDIKTRIVDQKPGPLQLGQADGVACRTMEMFHAFGFSERLLKEAYWVNETTFWKPDETQPDHIARSGRIQDVEDGLSEFPHVILNQARVHDFFLDVMRKSPNRLQPDYSRRLLDLSIETATARGGGANDYPVQFGSSGLIPNTRARWKRSGRGMSSAATARAAACVSRWAGSFGATRPIRRGASWTCWPSPTSLISG